LQVTPTIRLRSLEWRPRI